MQLNKIINDVNGEFVKWELITEYGNIIPENEFTVEEIDDNYGLVKYGALEIELEINIVYSTYYYKEDECKK